MWLRRFAWIPAAISVAAACAGGSSNEAGSGGFGGEGGSQSGGGIGGATSNSSGGSDAGFDVNHGSGGSQGVLLLYAHTDTTLFQIDPESPGLPLEQIGDFDCIDRDSDGSNGIDYAMTDLAVDAKGKLWGVSARYVHPLTIEGSAVKCGTPIPFDDPDNKFYALTFAPKGVLEPDKEVLIAGNSSGELWAIDDEGFIARTGHFGPVPANDGQGHDYDPDDVGQNWELSGDIVFLANEGSPVGYATVRDCPSPPSTSGCNSINTLIEIDVSKIVKGSLAPVTKRVVGQILKRNGCTDTVNNNYGNMYGIAAWNDKVYGFSRLGNIVDIDLVDASSCLVHSHDGQQFAGAGVTTIAPIVQPPS